MKTFLSFVGKETRHIVRDRRTMLILFGMPVMMMLLLGFAVRTDVKEVRTVVVTASADHLTRRLVAELAATEHFTLVGTAPTAASAERLIRCQRADMAVVFSPSFAARLAKGEERVQLITDGADPNMARQYTNYARSIFMQALAGGRAAGAGAGLPVSVKMLYNPEMQSAYNFVPGIMGMLLMIVCALMTSVSIVREKERGTMELLLVSPVRPLTVIVAKAVPYMVLSLVVLTAILLMSTMCWPCPCRVRCFGYSPCRPSTSFLPSCSVCSSATWPRPRSRHCSCRPWCCSCPVCCSAA